MERRRRRRPALALVLSACCWSAAGAVNVGDTVSLCANVTTVTVYKSSNSTSSSKAAAVAQITPADCGDDTVVEVLTTDDGIEVLDLRRQGIRVVESLPAADIVQLDNNLVQSFATGNSVTSLYLSNNSITSLGSFALPNSLRSLDLSDNELGSIDDANFPSALQYLNLSGNPIGSIQNAELPSDLIELNIADGSLSSLENFSFPSTVTMLNISSNPITRIAGIIFPTSLTELTILAVSASASATISVESALTLYDTGVLDSVLEEFEVRMTDAQLFESLALFDVSTTSTLECSDASASPYYVQDTMLCVLSDSDFAAKYAEVIQSAPSGAYDSSGYGSDGTSGSVEKVLPTLTETMEQSRSWFLIVAAAALTALSACFCVSACCRLLGRRATRSVRAAKAKDASNSGPATASNGSNQLWHALNREDDDATDAETQRLLDRMMTASPRPLDSSATVASPLDYVDRNLKEHEIAFAKLTQMTPMPASPSNAEGHPPDDEGSSSHFEYAVAVYRHRKIALKRLFIHSPSNELKQEAASQDTDANANGVGITSKTLSAFVQEIYLSSTLSHPNLVEFIGYLVERPRDTNIRPGSIALAMQYMDRGNLNDLIQSRKLALESGSAKITTKTPTAFDHGDITAKAVTWEDTPKDGNPLAAKWSWHYSSPAFKSKLAIAIDVVRALEYMHSLSPTLFHGNLSSRKIFFDKQWEVKLGDFTSSSALRRWSAAIIETDESEDSAVENDIVIHLDMTVWSAPEVVDGRQYTERSDIYSFGILLAQLDTYECPSDLQPMMDDADVPLLISNPRRHQQEGSVDGDAPSLVNLLMMQCRAFQPEDRPSASEVLQQLLRIEDEIGKVSSSSITSFY